MGKSSRSSSIKKNNQALKKKVFGPVETARIERQNAKLLALAQAPKELVMEDSKADEKDSTSPEKDSETSTKYTTMDVDEDAKPKRSKREIVRMQEARKARAVSKLRGSRSRPRNQKEFPAHKLKKKVHKR
ncbi:hypothetical protein CBER1_08103 [Cercospora berteroae]|uniref:DUF2423 domain-containing protein n=1 Tax=Cercospora berteroae TaxID=357750 RepID=A0A2S6BTE2_9PEZI|nr:hypothetical protein CBER1_08103 [Cercospora berteroae]